MIDEIGMDLVDHPCDIIKLATYAQSGLGIVFAACWIYCIDYQKRKKRVRRCMGPYGSSTRLLQPVFGGQWMYTSEQANQSRIPFHEMKKAS